MQHKAFVAGASGYTGRWLVRRLLAEGIPTVAHLRSDSPSLPTWHEDTSLAAAELDTAAWQPTALWQTLQHRRPTLVFALLGTTRQRAKQLGLAAAQAYAQIDRHLTLMLLEALQKASESAARPRFVYLSMVGVRPGSGNPYMQARWDVEQALRGGNLPYSIVRPSFVTGPDRAEHRPAERLAAHCVDGILAAAAKLGARRVQARYASISGEQLAGTLVRVALDPTAENRTFDLSELRGNL